MKINPNEPYKRLAIENIFANNTRKSWAQGSYYPIDYNGRTYIAFVKKVSIYKDGLVDKNTIIWQDSIGEKAKLGIEMLQSGHPVHFFKECKKSEYTYIGEVASFTQKTSGERFKTPSTFEIKFKDDIPQTAVDSFKDINSIEKRTNQGNEETTRAYGAIDPVRASEIGKAGEKIFNKHLKDKKHSYDDVIKMLDGKEVKNYIWENKDAEKYKPYDFLVNGIKIDVKATTTKSKNFYLSAAELDLIYKKKLFIVRMELNQELEYIQSEIIPPSLVIKNHELVTKKILAKRK